MEIFQIKRRYAEALRTLLKNWMPKHSDQMESLSADDIIRQDAKHTELRAEAVRAKFERRRERAYF
jgi:hypothetical protein